MTIASRIGSASAEIVVFNKGGRDFRLERLEQGRETPREFFYGFFDLEKAGLSAAMLSSAGRIPGAIGTLSHFAESAFARVTRVGARPFSARLRFGDVEPTKVLISYTDGFSLSLGLGVPRGSGRPIIMGGFHGLSDIEARARPAMRGLVRTFIRNAIVGLDHAFFFGPADRDLAIARYGVSAERSSVIPFGVDTEFWRPLPDESASDFVIAVGQDPNRDYDLLARAPGAYPIVIVTHRKVAVPAGSSHVRITTGDFFGADSITDEDLRRLYNIARAVVVPIKDVYQPAGYSVTLQAMSCGRPVILSKIKGLWSPSLLRDGENCLLVPPGDATALGEAIGRVNRDPIFAAQLGQAARETALTHFNLSQIGNGTINLAQHGLRLWAERHSESLA